MIWILSLFGKGLFPSSHPPNPDFLQSRTHRQWALFTKDFVLAVVLMPFQTICTFVASFPIPSPAPIPPRPKHNHFYFTLVSLQFLYRQSWMSLLFLCNEYFGRNERLRRNTFSLYGHTRNSWRTQCSGALHEKVIVDQLIYKATVTCLQRFAPTLQPEPVTSHLDNDCFPLHFSIIIQTMFRFSTWSLHFQFSH